jgi:flagellar hook-associated protein 1 FlgK
MVMGTISSAFHLISGALNADQSALSIVANNVANANTPGYSEERPNWQENPPVSINGVNFGTGVTETGATSLRDRVLLERLDQQQQSAAASTSRLSALNAMQALFTPDSGSSSATAGDIGSDITSFFNSFASLEANPTNNALRQQVLSTATTLTGDISNAANSLNSQQRAVDQEAAGVIPQVNALTAAIAQLNAQIQSTSPNADAGVLEDQRQQDLSKLSQLIGINQITTENNGLSITTASGQTLVSEGSDVPITSGLVNGATHLFVGTTDVTSQLASGGGSLGGYLTARDQDIPAAVASLDQLAFGISTAVNAQNNAGIDLNGIAGSVVNPLNPPLNIFSEPTAVAGSAAAMTVIMTDPNQIAAAGPAGGAGDNSNALAMANVAISASVNGKTPTDFYSNFVTMLGAKVAEVQTENTAANASVTQLQSQSNSLSAVNLNDEAAAMQQLERSYQAASQVFAILNTIMNSALNLGVQTAVA